MKSILAKQPPHSNPWLPMRRRQAMHTGGSSKSATRPNTERVSPAPTRLIAEDADGAPRLSSPSLTGMAPMIEPAGRNFKARSLEAR